MAFASSAMPGARIRMRGDDQNTLILTSCASDPAEAAFLLRTNGEPGKALKLLKKETGLSKAGKVEAFRASAALGLVPEAEWRQTAAETVENFDKAVGGDGRLPCKGITICGAPLEAIEDLSVLRLSIEEVKPDRELPVFLPRGIYGVKVLLVGVGAEKLCEHPLFNVQNSRFNITVEKAPDIIYLVGEFVLKHGARLRFNKDLPEELISEPIACRELEISWNPGRLVESEVNAIREELGRLRP